MSKFFKAEGQQDGNQPDNKHVNYVVMTKLVQASVALGVLLDLSTTLFKEELDSFALTTMKSNVDSLLSIAVKEQKQDDDKLTI